MHKNYRESQRDYEKHIYFTFSQVCITIYVMFAQIYELQRSSLWKRKDTEVVVSVLPTQTKGHNIIIHHSELCTLRPHQCLAGEVYFTFHCLKAVVPALNKLYKVDVAQVMIIVGADGKTFINGIVYGFLPIVFWFKN